MPLPKAANPRISEEPSTHTCTTETAKTELNMKTTKSFLQLLMGIVALVLLFAGNLNAQEQKESPFKAQEFQVDLFGAGATDDFDQDRADYGLGVGVNYFFTEQFGIGASTQTSTLR